MTAFVWLACFLFGWNIGAAAAMVRRDGIDVHTLVSLCVYSAALIWAIYLLASGA